MPLAPASLEPIPWVRRTVRAGEWEITALSDGHLRLDGGSMWGVVPATMWREWTPPAGDNTILLALRPFLAVRGDDIVVVEVGVGRRWDAKWRRIYGMLDTQSLEGSLRACGVTPEMVSHVVASHCHWDHIGAQVVAQGGRLEPLFPNAVHYAPAVEIEVARRPGHARAPSYRAEDVLPLEERGMLKPYMGSREILPGLRCRVLSGHSDGVSLITLNEQGPGERAIFWSDIVPTAHHIQPAYIMAYDIDVVRSFEVRSKWLEKIANEAWISLLYHDVDHPFGKLSRDSGTFGDRARYSFEPA